MKSPIGLLMLIVLFTTLIQAQDKCKMVTDEKSGRQMLIGETDREAFKDTTFSWWYDSEYDNYNVKGKELSGVKDKINDYNFTIVMGTWCSDSRREIPRFYKVLDSLGVSSDKIKLIMVDRNKKDLSGEIDSLKIELVPTIIFYKDGEEKGRIEEAPKETLETDTYNIIFNKPEEQVKKE